LGEDEDGDEEDGGGGGSFGVFDGLTRYLNVEDSPVRRSGVRKEGLKAKVSPLLARPLRIWET